ncbi:bifunctional glutamate N-acetyltransferase/amino-acid acetyltransferase ArgJ [Desulfosediminicola flagellatus]|uniref:bifunctional glutamate N-acetyltransferase/amino-acid acetyltransferase ArgJ n=1 Tax=Desulfosediminicola flagellatus TaxID=2569541 RepID=UPI0010AC683B|nr:bifunctional glutamate N-acetyltransferase/amino-acid acetyltransferase ArgJ [Desulfosediminicola flagellatus]
MSVKGFMTSAVAAGVKYQDRLDLGLIYSETPAVTAGVFTTSQVKAAPVIIDIERLKQEGRSQAILVNSGCANACTGKQGMESALRISEMLSTALKIPDNMVQLSSTGVIGDQLKMSAFENSMQTLVDGLSADNFDAVAKAIMTTDTVPKTASRTVMIGGKEVTLMGMAKGAGMIMPNMATMLAFVITDAQIGFPQLHSALSGSVERTFNRITVDGDTSTNDMVLVMANGKADNPWIDEESTENLELFQDSLESLLKDLALMIVTDGEGASKCITIRVCGAREDSDAEKVARTVANSNLVKTAFFGEDANWGRIIAAMGRSGVKFNPDRVDIAFNDVVIVRDGLAVGKDAEEQASKVLKEKKFNVCIDLKEGNGCEEVYTCDFSIDYVKINADYRS